MSYMGNSKDKLEIMRSFDPLVYRSFLGKAPIQIAQFFEQSGQLTSSQLS